MTITKDDPEFENILMGLVQHEIVSSSSHMLWRDILGDEQGGVNDFQIGCLELYRYSSEEKLEKWKLTWAPEPTNNPDDYCHVTIKL